MIKIKQKLKNIKLIRPFAFNRYISIAIILVSSLVLISVGAGLYIKDRIFPSIFVLGYDLGTKRENEASAFLSQNINTPEKLILVSNEKSFDLSLSNISFSYDFDKTTQNAYRINRSGGWRNNIFEIISSPFEKKEIDLVYNLDQDKLDEYLQVVSGQVLTEPTYPSVYIESGAIKVDKGKAGELLDKDKFLALLDSRIKSANFSEFSLPLKKTDPTLSDEESELLKNRAEKFMNKTFSLKNDYDTFIYDAETILSFLDFDDKFNYQKISGFVDNEVSPKIERLPQNAVLHFEGDMVTEFIPAKDGLSIETDKLVDEIKTNLLNLEVSEEKSVTINVPVVRATPDVTLNEVNNLGIKELLGRGASKFRGSISARIHNVSLASSKFNGVLVEPGESFSFNKTLGDVSTYTGYKQAYIIKDGRTVLGDGGGVCQVSTTLFRALLDAGLPITERHAHSYRVSYYEQGFPPGLDATVFDPTSDLKFINDTPGHLLIQTEFDAKAYSLVFEIYGTSDGRVAETSTPKIISSTAPPEDLYIDDPTLPQGTVKQIDYKSWGAKVTFDYSVERYGEQLIDETYVSNYRPWQAVFLRGTGPSS